jgi:polygalacturonase
MDRRFNVLDYGAKADGITLDSPAIQQAVDACAAAGGGMVWFPKGSYVLATVFLKDGVHIEFEEGTDILGCLDFYAYAQQEPVDYPLYQDASHSYFDLAMFVGKYCKDISITGKAHIDMRSIWDEDGVRGEAIRHRGPKCISLKECENVLLADLSMINVTDLAIYFAGCNHVDIHGIQMKVYIDGISPDNCKDVKIYDCDVDSGDDGIVFKSSYTLNRIDICKDIEVRNCRVKSRCSALKFGTETNGGFENILFEDIDVVDSVITAIAIESVDGAIMDGLTMRNIRIKNSNGLLYVTLGDRMRGPEGREVGAIRNLTLENITADGPYEPFVAMPPSYFAYQDQQRWQIPWHFKPVPEGEERLTREDNWQTGSSICGMVDHPLENITLRNIHLRVAGGAKTFEREVPEPARKYPEITNMGFNLPTKGIFFRHIRGLTLENVTVETIRPDVREDFIFEDVTFSK